MESLQGPRLHLRSSHGKRSHHVVRSDPWSLLNFFHLLLSRKDRHLHSVLVPNGDGVVSHSLCFAGHLLTYIYLGCSQACAITGLYIDLLTCFRSP